MTPRISVDDLPRTLAQREADELSEHEHQCKVIAWAEEQVKLGLRPELANLYAVPNAARRTKAERGWLISEGMKPGVPDLCLAVARGGFHGLYLEMKTSKRRAKPTANQRDWLERLDAQGYLAFVCTTHQDATLTLEEYLDGKFTQTT